MRQKERTEKKRFEPEEFEKYKEVNNNIKRCMKKAKENWIREQCGEIEYNLRKNNSKTGDRLDHCETRKTRSFRKMPHRRTRDTEPMDRVLH